jgi:hypothetical protein
MLTFLTNEEIDQIANNQTISEKDKIRIIKGLIETSDRHLMSLKNKILDQFHEHEQFLVELLFDGIRYRNGKT